MNGLEKAYKVDFKDNLNATERLSLSPYIFKAFTNYLSISNDDAGELVKAVKEKDSSKIWVPHTYKPQAILEDQYYLYLAEPLTKFQNAVLEKFNLGARRETLMKAMPKYESKDADLIERLMTKYFPSIEKNKAMAEMIAVRSHLLGMIRAGESAALPFKLVNPNKLPKTIIEAMKKYQVKPNVARSMLFSKDFTGSLIQTELDKVREGTKRVILDGYRNNFSTGKIRQNLFHELGSDNRDWRRVAVTEVSYGDSNGYVDSIAQGEWVVGDSAPDACEHCLDMIHGKIYQKSDAPGNWETQIWVGKTNYGRYASHFTRDTASKKWVKRPNSLIWMPTIPLHPNCRCNWTRFIPESQWIDEKGYPRMKEENSKKWEQWYEFFKRRKA